MDWAEGYLHAKFHLDTSNRLAKIHQRHIQHRQTNRTDNGPAAQGEPFHKRSPKNTLGQCGRALNGVSTALASGTVKSIKR